MDRIPDQGPMESTPDIPPLAGLDPADLLKQGAAEDTFMGNTAQPFNPPPVEELAPLFPQFEILELIGKGGMGAVYKVRQVELDRIVALKILPPSIGGTPGFSGRFMREAKALAKLNHPGIVTIHESGQREGLFFIVMEFVDGVNLRQLMGTGRISAREALAIVPQICDALQFAHDQGIVHRDIKPENILLDRLGRVKVADFGIAKLMGVEDPAMADAGAGVAVFLTEAGKVMGTPQYMAPEQLDRPEDVDHRADIYALGVVFYQMLTGELPGQRIEVPSSKVRIDVRLDEVVLHALARNPEMRYQTAGEFRTAVDDLHGPEMPVAGPPVMPVVEKKERGMFARWWWIFFVMVPAGILLGGSLAAAVTYFLPKKYEVEAVVEVRGPKEGPQFFSRQFEKIKSRELLGAVTDDLGLASRWGVRRETALQTLQAITGTGNIRGTDLISIKLRHTDREEAVEILKGVISRYQQSGEGDMIVHESPFLPARPASPNVTLNLVLGAGAGFLASPLLALAVMGLLQLFVKRRERRERASEEMRTGMIEKLSEPVQGEDPER